MSRVRGLPGMVVCGASMVLAMTSPLAAQEVPWRTDYNGARKEAKEKNKPIVLDFGIDGCDPCKQLDASTFRDPAVVKALTERFVAVKVNASKDPELAKALGITSFPTLVFAAPNGKILGQQDGYVDAAHFSQQLERLQADAGRTAASGETNVPTADRGRRARDLLTQAKEDFRQQNDASCLEHCKELTTGYADQPEAAEAGRLAAKIKDDPERLALACEKLTDSLGNTYLELADSMQRKGQLQQALYYLEKTLRACPGTHAAQLAQEQMLLLKDQLAKQSDGKALIRSQMPR
jgi:thioredoxin-related protein